MLVAWKSSRGQVLAHLCVLCIFSLPLLRWFPDPSCPASLDLFLCYQKALLLWELTLFHLEILSKCHFRCCLFASAYVLYFVEVKSRSVSCVQLFVVPWTIACQASLSAGFSRQGHRSGSPCPSLGDLPDPGIKPRSPASQADSLQFELPGKPLLCGLIVNTGDSKKKNTGDSHSLFKIS